MCGRRVYARPRGFMISTTRVGAWAILIAGLVAAPGCKRAEEAADKAADKGRAAASHMSDLVDEGQQVAEVVAEIHGVVSEVVDSDTTVEPIYQKLDDEEARAETDAAIRGMPRTEVVEGLTVGFEDVTNVSTSKHETRRGFLVVWRQADHRVGFLYRTRREIDIERIVAETPRLIALVRKATD